MAKQGIDDSDGKEVMTEVEYTSDMVSFSYDRNKINQTYSRRIGLIVIGFLFFAVYSTRDIPWLEFSFGAIFKWCWLLSIPYFIKVWDLKFRSVDNMLNLNEHGFQFEGVVGGVLVPWDQVEKVSEEVISNEPTLCIDLKNGSKLMAQLPMGRWWMVFVKGLFMKRYKSKTVYMIPLGLFKSPHSDIAKVFYEYTNQANKEETK